MSNQITPLTPRVGYAPAHHQKQGETMTEQHVQTATAAGGAVKALFGSISAALGWMMTYSGIDHEVFGIFSLLVVVDFISGVGKAYVLGQAITSHRAKYGVLSKFSLLLLPIVMALAAKGVGADMGTFFVWGVNLLILSELYSIVGNIYSLRSGKELPEWDVVSQIGTRLRKQFGGDDGK